MCDRGKRAFNFSSTENVTNFEGWPKKKTRKKKNRKNSSPLPHHNLHHAVRTSRNRHKRENTTKRDQHWNWVAEPKGSIRVAVQRKAWNTSLPFALLNHEDTCPLNEYLFGFFWFLDDLQLVWCLIECSHHRRSPAERAAVFLKMQAQNIIGDTDTCLSLAEAGFLSFFLSFFFFFFFFLSLPHFFCTAARSVGVVASVDISDRSVSPKRSHTPPPSSSLSSSSSAIDGSVEFKEQEAACGIIKAVAVSLGENSKIGEKCEKQLLSCAFDYSADDEASRNAIQALSMVTFFCYDGLNWCWKWWWLRSTETEIRRISETFEKAIFPDPAIHRPGTIPKLATEKPLTFSSLIQVLSIISFLLLKFKSSGVDIDSILICGQADRWRDSGRDAHTPRAHPAREPHRQVRGFILRNSLGINAHASWGWLRLTCCSWPFCCCCFHSGNRNYSWTRGSLWCPWAYWRTHNSMWIIAPHSKNQLWEILEWHLRCHHQLLQGLAIF